MKVCINYLLLVLLISQYNHTSSGLSSRKATFFSKNFKIKYGSINQIQPHQTTRQSKTVFQNVKKTLFFFIKNVAKQVKDLKGSNQI